MSTPLIRETIQRTMKEGLDPVSLHWFDISPLPLNDIAIRGTHSSWLLNYRPPFDHCVVLWRGQWRDKGLHELMMMVHGSDPSKKIVVSVWKAKAGQPRSTAEMGFVELAYTVVDGKIMFGPVLESEKEPISESVAKTILGLVATWFSALAKGCEVHSLEIKDTFTNRRKMAQGKKPMYEWKTVVLKSAKPRSESLGGTHASPRLHERRGHLRKMRSGKEVWVKPHKVGNAKLGVIFHDYEVRT